MLGRRLLPTSNVPTAQPLHSRPIRTATTRHNIQPRPRLQSEPRPHLGHRLRPSLRPSSDPSPTSSPSPSPSPSPDPSPSPSSMPSLSPRSAPNTTQAPASVQVPPRAAAPAPAPKSKPQPMVKPRPSLSPSLGPRPSPIGSWKHEQCLNTSAPHITHTITSPRIYKLAEYFQRRARSQHLHRQAWNNNALSDVLACMLNTCM